HIEMRPDPERHGGALADSAYGRTKYRFARYTAGDRFGKMKEVCMYILGKKKVSYTS
ncbi:hypothetical protein ACJX0J_029618, partial [Zea mays]